MGLLDRISRLVRANVNEILDSAEDPEKTLNQLLRDMESDLSEGRERAIEMVAQEKVLQREFEDADRLASDWESKAKLAVDAGKNDLAREALKRRRDNLRLAEVYEQQLEAQRRTVTLVNGQLRQLRAKYEMTLGQRDALIARIRSAKAIDETSKALGSFDPIDPTSELDRMERRIRETEAKAEARLDMQEESIEAQFAELEDPEIELELEALKLGLPSDQASTALDTGGESG